MYMWHILFKFRFGETERMRVGVKVKVTKHLNQGRAVSVAGLCFILLGIFHANPFWLGAFPLRSQLLLLWGLPCMLFPVSPLLPLRFSLCLGLRHFNNDVSCSGPLWVPLDWDSVLPKFV